jgi:hypothetical protein
MFPDFKLNGVDPQIRLTDAFARIASNVAIPPARIAALELETDRQTGRYRSGCLNPFAAYPRTAACTRQSRRLAVCSGGTNCNAARYEHGISQRLTHPVGSFVNKS